MASLSYHQDLKTPSCCTTPPSTVTVTPPALGMLMSASVSSSKIIATAVQPHGDMSTPVSAVGNERRGKGWHAMADALEARRIPSKFLQVPESGAGVTGFATIASEPIAPTLEATVAAESAVTLATPYSEANLRSAKMRDGLPEMPQWVVGLMAGMLSFGLIVGVVLYFANFPPELSLFPGLRMRRRKNGYVRVEECDEDDSRSNARRGCRFRGAGADGSYTTSATTGAKASRRRNHLSVDTSARYAGLGIAIPGNTSADWDEDLQVSQRRRSYDEEKLRRRQPPPMSPARFAWEALTAPIPAITTFGSRGAKLSTGAPHSAVDGRMSYKHAELESGTYTPCSDVENERYDIPTEIAIASQKSANVFHKIGESVEHAAEKLAKALSDQVKLDSEEDLLLPVRVTERERPYSPGLHGAG